MAENCGFCLQPSVPITRDRAASASYSTVMVIISLMATRNVTCLKKTWRDARFDKGKSGGYVDEL